MLIVAENINASRKVIREKLLAKDQIYFQNLARKMVRDGAGMLDLNIGELAANQGDLMTWLVQTVQQSVDVPLCLDSPYPELIQAGLECYDFSRGKPLINSVTAEGDRISEVLPLVKKHQCSVVALVMDENGIPENAQDRFQVSETLIKTITGFGIPETNIYLDPLVLPVATNSCSAQITLKTLDLINHHYPHIKTIAGMSNISYGLPLRKNLNQSFLPLLIQNKVNALIMDPTDRKLISLLYGTQALLGNDPYCKNYLQAYRKGQL